MIKPYGARVIVKKLEKRSADGGIILPESVNDTNQEAELVAIGTLTKPNNLAIGDKIMMVQNGGTEITYKGEKYIVLNETEIIAVMD